jgi:hypothetical protein
LKIGDEKQLKTGDEKQLKIGENCLLRRDLASNVEFKIIVNNSNSYK